MSGRSEPPMPARACVLALAELHVARLRHETFDHAVKHHAVIVASCGNCRDLGDVQGCCVLEQVDLDRAVGFACDVNLKASRKRGTATSARTAASLYICSNLH